MYFIRIFLTCLVFSTTNIGLQNAFADDLFSSQDLAATEETFLPVEQAYRVLVQKNNSDISMDWNIAEGYFLYQHQFKLKAKTPEQAEFIPLTFSPGLKKYDEYYEKELEVYYNNTQVTGALPNLTAPYELEVTSQGCADAGLCYPPRKQYFSVEADGIVLELTESQISTPIQSAAINSTNTISAANNANNLVASPGASQPVILIILFATIGGLILNLMPCVFPVLSLKALSMASSQLSPHKQHLHGWAYTAGVVGSFLVAGAAILIAREAGAMLGWGFQLQEPLFVACMAYLFFIMGLTLSGMFNVGTQLMGAGQNLTTGHGLKSSFFTGVLAALVASPCTAPFMATALGVALTKPAPAALLIFASLGLGMALPFILLSYIPALANKMPSPGPWMETLKQFLAFPLYATSVWLLWVFGNQSSSDGAALLALGAVFIAFGIWLYTLQPNKRGTLAFTKMAALLCIVATIALAIKGASIKHQETGSSEKWEPYSEAALNEYRQKGRPVFIDFTADWCITCKVNERVALGSDDFFATAKALDIVLMAGDWTNANPEISKVLKQFGRSGVPLYLMYPKTAGAQPQVLPQILTPAIVQEAMQQAVK